MRNDRPDKIVKVSFEFALMAIQFCEKLEEQRKYIVARQLLKSSTSIGANIREDQKADFIHKLKIAAKEADKTKYWLELCKASPTYPFDENLETKLLNVKV